MTTYAYDFETSYTKERSITTMGHRNYLAHPDTDIYLLSVVGSDGFRWVGNPKDFNWDMLNDGNWIAHNDAFDSQCVNELRRRGLPIPADYRHGCSADLAAARQLPRALANVSQFKWGVKLDKSIRDGMKGREYHELNAEERLKVDNYALDDSEYCLKLWQEEAPKWSSKESAVSNHTCSMVTRGIGIDAEKVAAGIESLNRVKFEACTGIPWAGDLDPKGKEIPITSPKQLRAHCVKIGIEPPTSTDSKSDDWQKWESTYNEQSDFVKAIQQYRRANRLEKVLQSMKRRIFDGNRLAYGLKYFGAPHTGRWSGDSGLNLQNLPREAFEGVDARACLVPRPGYKFLIADYSQIEPRVTLWLAKSKEVLELIRGGMDLYEAHARATKGYTDSRPLKEGDPKLRFLCKSEWLGLGYGMGKVRHQEQARSLLGLDFSDEEAKDNVDRFRSQNPGIGKLWRELDKVFHESIGVTFDMVLPSKRTVNYFDVDKTDDKSWAAKVVQGSPRKFFWGGKLFENMVQATARDVMAEAIVKLEAAGLPVVLHVHDEVICEVPEADVEQAQAELISIMTTPPDWATGLPLAVECHVRSEYGK